MTRKISFLLLLISLFAGGVSRADSNSSRQILDRAAAVFNGSKSIKAEFSTDVDGTTTAGTITIQGDKFRISSKEYSTWYDGKTQWSYSSAANEVNITEPTPEELTEINPFVIISSLRKSYNSAKVKSPAGFSKIMLIPKSTSHADIKKAEITFNDKTSMPTQVTLEMSAGSRVNIVIKSIVKGNILPASTFIFNKKELPGAEVIDLR
ncbi:MAG: outer-membrane lipoprotein carrier protein LolA [Lachnospiraceae bacterium]|nr:outer-membrane lipoprotein carrier protein LolA [Lachnospiraceae bacterium]